MINLIFLALIVVVSIGIGLALSVGFFRWGYKVGRIEERHELVKAMPTLKSSSQQNRELPGLDEFQDLRARNKTVSTPYNPADIGSIDPGSAIGER
jgi:hypothetical protein